MARPTLCENMKILALNNISAFTPQRAKDFGKTNYGLKMSQPLAHDSVSFGSTLGEAYINQLHKPAHVRKMQRNATIYMDVIESIAMKLKDHGISFDRAYCEKHAIKSPEACGSKVSRSGTFKVPDSIRATLYCSDIYNLSILNDKILPAFEERGYIVAKTEVPVEQMLKKGYLPTKQELEKKEVSVLDLDIRLYDVEDQVGKLDPKYKYSIGNPPNSGYEDVQIRFKKEDDTSQSPDLFELIILPGKNFAKAKSYESDKVYSQTRKLGELAFIKNMKNERDIALAKRYIAMIKSMLNLGISQKLFGAAKNLDVYGMENNIVMNMSEGDINVIKSAFADLRRVARNYYDTIELRAKSFKTIARIKSERANDARILTETQKNLLEAIDFFNNAGNLKKLPEID